MYILTTWLSKNKSSRYNRTSLPAGILVSYDKGLSAFLVNNKLKSVSGRFFFNAIWYNKPLYILTTL